VASEEITCSEMGVGILKAGGTAVDAAISTTLCIGVINSFSSGIGGGGFMLVRIPSVNGSNVTAIDFRETSPSGSFRDMYTEVNHGAAAAQVGGLSIGVPGELRGLEAGKHLLRQRCCLRRAHRLYGNLTWERVVKPAADMAAGFRVGRELARRLRVSTAERAAL
jgi:gamma-glutamyltranspeptidase/glutathione hydrolase/leukotriene-C4 hydrolase